MGADAFDVRGLYAYHKGNILTAVTRRTFMNKPLDPEIIEHFEERRSRQRFERRLALHMDERGTRRVATAENISTGGLYLHTHIVLNECAILTIHIPRSKDEMTVVDARVVHSNPGHGAGLSFQSLSHDQSALLDEFVRNY